jgi:LysM repeat protein
MRRQFIWILSTLLTAFLSVTIVVAQSACSALVLDALSAVDNNCTGLGRNQACYGFDQVEASFLVDVADDVFTQPAQITPLADLETIRTAPMNLETGIWGVAVMNLQANMPNSLPGQNVTFILLGDVELENAVAPEDVFQASDGISVAITYAAGANIRSGPGTNFNVIGGVTLGTEFIVDGISPDGNWLRTVYQERPAWLGRTVLAPDIAIDTLPVLNNDVYTPMQAFYLRTGIGQPQCNEVPDDSLLIQGPEDIQIQLTVNGANIELGSSGALRVVIINGEPLLEIAVLDGEFVIKADENNPQDVVIPAGFRSLICLGDADSRGLDGEANDLVASCGATSPQPIPLEEFDATWCRLENLPSDILNYDLSTCYGSHTVSAGENLFRIAQFYCVPLNDLIALNNLPNANNIVVGQELIIPPYACNGVGSTSPPASALTQIAPESTQEAIGASCANFALLSPVGRVDAGNQTFSWTSVTGTDIAYQLTFFSYEGLEVESFFTDATSYSLNLGAETATGGEFSWEVRAYQGDNYLCVSGRSPTLQRLDPNPLPPPNNFSVSISCTSLSGVYTATVSWYDLGNNETITVKLDSPPYGSPTNSSSNTSDTIILNISSFASANVIVTTSGGFSQTKACI